MPRARAARSWIGRCIPIGRRQRQLLFAFAPPADAWPSARLRGHQLIELIRQTCDDVTCHAVSFTDIVQSRGETVVLTKSALHSMYRETLLRLPEQGHCLIADPVDLPLDEELMALADILLASSVAQDRYFRSRFPATPVVHVTHHVDLRLPKIRPRARTGSPRFGYFGKSSNCLHVDAIRDLVGVFHVDYPDDATWMRHLADYDAHYAVRPPAEWPNVFKPFLKGFVAAHCGVPVVAGADDVDAGHYLGADYPFLIRDVSLQAVRAQLADFAGAYGSARWRAALAATTALAARSSPKGVKRELRAFLKALPA